MTSQDMTSPDMTGADRRRRPVKGVFRSYACIPAHDRRPERRLRPQGSRADPESEIRTRAVAALPPVQRDGLKDRQRPGLSLPQPTRATGVKRGLRVVSQFDEGPLIAKTGPSCLTASPHKQPLAAAREDPGSFTWGDLA